jgi:hypothetical protein
MEPGRFERGGPGGRAVLDLRPHHSLADTEPYIARCMGAQHLNCVDALVFPRIPGFHRQRCLHDRRQRNRHGSRIMIRYYTGRKSRVECEQAHT